MTPMKTCCGRETSTVERGSSFEIEVDGESIVAFAGESVAAALLAAGRRVFRRSPRFGEPRGAFCGMGACFDCLMIVDGMPGVRACQTPARPGMKIETQDGLSMRMLAP